MQSIPHTSGIYQILCVPTGKVYIGSSEDLLRRYSKHFYRLRHRQHENQYLQHAWDKYGESAFEFSVIELVLLPFCLEREQYWMDKLNACNRDKGFNISIKAGAPFAGRKHSPDALAKMAERSRGFRHSEETKRMMSERNKGIRFGVWTEESSRKHAESMRGFKHTPETIEKIRQQRLTNNAAARRFVITTPAGDELEIENLSRFCREHNLSEDCMQAVASGKNKQHKGFRCRRLSI